MTTVDAPPVPAQSPEIVVPSGIPRRAVVQGGIGVAVLVVAMFLLPALTSTFWVQNFTSAAILSIVAAATGMLYGRVGLVSLGQIALYGVGTWVTMRLGFATDLPYPVLILLAGVITAVIGVLLGLPALRLQGLYLALITLMAAAGFLVILANTKFPTGGPGFKGLVVEVTNSEAMRRPDIAETDYGFYRYVLVVAVIMFGLAVSHLVSKPGRAWASIRQSEAAALAAGVNTVTYKLWAWALASFMTGCAGALLAGHVGSPSTFTFTVEQNIILMAVVVMGGVASLWGGVVAGLLAAVLPEVLQKWGFSSNWSLILFGTGLLINLLITSWQLDKAGIKE
jgi:branched-chain amino acid transport system permease protein